MSATAEDLDVRSAMTAEAWEDVDRIAAVMPWRELRARFIALMAAMFARWIAPDQAHFQEQRRFAITRFDAGVHLVLEFRRLIIGERPLTMLDIGAGNGGIAFAFANDAANRVVALDIVPNPQAVAFRKELGSRLHLITGDGAALPFASDSFDVVLLLDVLEHLRQPRATAAEIIRILRPGGLCFLSTPARLEFAFRRDPHYGVPSLALLPNEVQRFIVDRVLRRSVIGHDGCRAHAYDVDHLYWNAAEVARLFGGSNTVDVLYPRMYSPPGPFTRKWLRHPSLAFEQLRYDMRHWFFGYILIYKGSPPPGAPRFDRLIS